MRYVLQLKLWQQSGSRPTSSLWQGGSRRSSALPCSPGPPMRSRPVFTIICTFTFTKNIVAIWEIPSQMKSTPFMAAKSLLISFNQILASKMLLLFVPTSASSFSICERWEWKNAWNQKKEKYQILKPWQGFPEFVGLHRLFRCSQWFQPKICNVEHLEGN